MTENGKRRPWWAVAIAGGFGAVLGTGALLGFAGTRHAEPVVSTAVAASGPALPAGAISLDQRLDRMEAQLKTLGEDMAEVKRRLPAP